MKIKRFLILPVFFVLLVNNTFSQYGNYSISIKGNYTTTARLYPLNEQNDLSPLFPYYSIDNVYGYGLEVMRNILSEDLFIGVSGEYIFGDINNQSPIEGVSYKDGFDLYLFELNCLLRIPFSTDKVKIYIGGGANYAVGYRKRALLDVASESINNPASYGIQVMTGVEYLFYRNFSVKWEMKFRDPMVEAENKFNVRQVRYNNVNYNLPTPQFKSKINLDGIAFEMGFSYHF